MSMAAVDVVESAAAALGSRGLSVYGLVDRAGLDGIEAAAGPEESARYGLPGAGAALVVAMAYDPRPVLAPEPGDEPGGPPPYLAVGAFAAANRYAALARLLTSAGRELARVHGLPRSAFRAAVNSRLSEKRLAVMAGLGYAGRSSLVVTNAYGPACVLGALLLPPALAGGLTEGPRGGGSPCRGNPEDAAVPGRLCGTCRACVDACPTGAISVDRGLDLGLCIQFWTTREGEAPVAVREAWGSRLYGCDECVRACPASARAYAEPAGGGRSPAEAAAAFLEPAEKRPGRLVSASFASGATDGELAAYLRKTALGMKRIDMGLYRRNAGYAFFR